MSTSSPAANDNLVDALLLDLDGRVSIDVSGYTREPGETSAQGNANNRTAWFVWTAPEGGPSKVSFATYGSSYDTTINIYKGNPANPTPLVTSLLPVSAPENPVIVDDDAAINVTQGYVTWSPVAGTTYYISVGRISNAGGGNSLLEATFGALTEADGTTAVVPNDSLAGALEVVSTVTNSTLQVPRNQDVLGTTIGATAEVGEQVLGAASAPKGGTVWYRYKTGANPEVFSVQIDDIPGEVVGELILQAFTNTASPSVPTFPQLNFQEEDKQSSIVGTPRMVINGAANTEYYFRVTSTDGDGNAFNLRLDSNPAVPGNDQIAAAVALPAQLPSVRNQGEDIYSATQTDATGFNGSTSGANVWYSWKAPASGLVKLRAIAPTASATTGNFHPVGSTFRFDANIYFDTVSPTDAVFNTANSQSVGGFDDDDPQEKTFYAVKDVVYYIEIGGDSNTNSAGRGYFGFALEDARLTDAARTGISYGSEGVLKTLGVPVVNRNGDIGFSASLEIGGPVNATRDSGLFLFNGSSTRLAAVEGQQEFETSADIDGDGIQDDKVTFSLFSNVFLADRAGNDTNPDLGFTATLIGRSNDEPITARNNRGLYYADPANGGAREFRLGDYVENSFTWGDAAGFLSAFNTPVREPADNTGIVSGRMVGIPIFRDTGLFATSGNVVVQEEDPAPNTSNGVEFGDVTGTPSVNGSDALAFRSILRGEGVTALNDVAIYSVADYNGNLTALNYRLRLRKGLTAAGPAGSTLAGGATLFSLGEPRVNARGKIATLVSFKPASGAPVVTAASDTAIVSDLLTNDYSFAIVAREGDQARDAKGASLPGVRFASFTAPVLITNNAVIFSATLVGTGVTRANNSGIWLWDGTSTYLIARTGTAAPGIVTAGATFRTLGAPVANASGRVAFTATLVGAGINATNDAGLWTVSQDGVTPSLRLRKGELYDFGRTELPIRRTITSLSITTGSGGDDGYPRGMDQDGNVAVLIGLSKGRLPAGQAILKVTP